MAKRLQPATISPPEMYVERSADRQLREIIIGMGRPGYILVARQMGKTNLLLNARRCLEKETLRFIYVDLSARIDTPEAYYGLLLNTAFSVHPEIFSPVNDGQPPRQEYSAFQFEASLRSVLKQFPGRLVFVLDEIDSLGNYPFSDRIFSQIRSMYFSRSNFEEYSRITYILSGVAEPSDLIKDKNVSPFNIGEKIYLNDFTREEFCLFLKKANLQLDAEIYERIFYWAGGNPRITWDICSEVEDIILQGAEASHTLIDQIVQKLYLSTFDRAPIDHIRNIVQTDRQIRQAIADLKSDAAESIPDKTRNKLYLAGIVGMSPMLSARPTIKNKVIDESLSERWLADVEKQSRGLLQLARENYEEKRYEPAIAFYEEYLTQGDIEKSSADAYRLATSYFNVRRYAKAIDWFNSYLDAGTDSAELRATANYLLGRANIVIGNFETAAKNLRHLTVSNERAKYLLAPGLLASTLLNIDFEKYEAEATEIAESGIALANTSNLDQSIQADARIICLDCLAMIQKKKGNIEEATNIIDRAMAERSSSYGALLSLRLLDLLPPGSRREEVIGNLADSVIELGSTVAERRLDNSYRQIALPALVALRLAGRDRDFMRLLKFLEQSGECDSAERYITIDTLYAVCVQQSPEKAAIFLRDLVSEFGDHATAQEHVLNAIKALIVRHRDFAYSQEYINAVASREGDLSFEEADYLAIAFITSDYLRHDDTRQLRSLDRLPSQLRAENAQSLFAYIFALNFEMLRQERLGRVEEAIKDAREIIRFLESSQADTIGLTPDIRSAIEGNAESVLRRHEPKIRAVNPYKGIGRNAVVHVRYADGREVRSKFKTVQRDLVLGVCELLQPDRPTAQ